MTPFLCNTPVAKTFFRSSGISPNLIRLMGCFHRFTDKLRMTRAVLVGHTGVKIETQTNITSVPTNILPNNYVIKLKTSFL